MKLILLGYFEVILHCEIAAEEPSSAKKPRTLLSFVLQSPNQSYSSQKAPIEVSDKIKLALWVQSILEYMLYPKKQVVKVLCFYDILFFYRMLSISLLTVIGLGYTIVFKKEKNISLLDEHTVISLSISFFMI